MKRFPHITVFTFALSILTGCIHAQVVQNITPHNSQPVQSVVTDHDPTGACSNYAQIYVNWKTGTQTACVSGQYQATGGGGGGAAATVTAGTTTTGPAGTNASVVNSGTSNAAVFDFTIPRGATGPTGPTGATGPAGTAATVTVGTTTTGAAGTNASVTNSGTPNAAIFNFTIPRGADGTGGSSGSVYPFTATATSAALTIGTDCSSATPCRARVGSTTVSYDFSSEVDAASGATDDIVFIYIDAANPSSITVGSQRASVTCPISGNGTGCVAVTGITNFPPESIPLYRWTMLSGAFSAQPDFDARANLYTSMLAGSGCIIVTQTATGRTVSLDTTNSSCTTGGGGTTFNGGTITTPLTVSTGTTSSTLTVTSANTNSTDFILANTSTGGHSFHISSSGSGNNPGVFAVWDNLFRGTGGSIFALDDTGNGTIRTVAGGGFGWSNDATNSFSGSVDTRLVRDAAGEVSVEDGSGNWGTLNAGTVKLGTATAPACDASHKNAINVDGTGHLQFCDGTAYHTITYTN